MNILENEDDKDFPREFVLIIQCSGWLKWSLDGPHAINRFSKYGQCSHSIVDVDKFTRKTSEIGLIFRL